MVHPGARSPEQERPGLRYLVLAALWVYRNWFTRYTPGCPDEVSCSEFAVTAVKMYGATEGLELALMKVRQCGQGSVHLPHMQDATQ
jgi:putative component of membrane protein insertase Oxa1/YidC/SpoIIIJ protein YidD